MKFDHHSDKSRTKHMQGNDNDIKYRTILMNVIEMGDIILKRK